jgi:hypothetical protein
MNARRRDLLDTQRRINRVLGRDRLAIPTRPTLWARLVRFIIGRFL